MVRLGRSQRARAMRPNLGWPTRREVLSMLSSREATPVRVDLYHGCGYLRTGARRPRPASLSALRRGDQRTRRGATSLDPGLPPVSMDRERRAKPVFLPEPDAIPGEYASS